MSAADAVLPLFIADMDDALGEVVRFLGGAKKVGPMLWPDKSMDQAQRLLLDCLNPDRPAHLTPAQTLFLFKLARQNNFHNVKRWFDQECGYIPSEPMEPEDERAKLQRLAIDAIAGLAHITERLERLGAPTLMRVAK